MRGCRGLSTSSYFDGKVGGQTYAGIRTVGRCRCKREVSQPRGEPHRLQIGVSGQSPGFGNCRLKVLPSWYQKFQHSRPNFDLHLGRFLYFNQLIIGMGQLAFPF